MRAKSKGKTPAQKQETPKFVFEIEAALYGLLMIEFIAS